MALTSFCHLHILSDAKQKLYKPCDYIIKRFYLWVLSSDVLFVAFLSKWEFFCCCF
uniref:KAT8 regulatory NSL complex subunit 2 n=1 Tax=Rhizophora mucronata TaxID=61149 RepID=A0A2P2M0X1_RHIMU